MLSRKILYGMTLPQLQQAAAELEMPRFTAAQIASWLYAKGVGSIAEMTNISLHNRELLEAKYDMGLSVPLSEAVSVDGTRKYLFQTGGGHFIESAYIPDGDRATLCVSSQAGCRMGCEFCLTGKQGLQGQLSAGEILNQYASLPGRGQVTNMVLMGMGEPLDNVDNVMQALDILTAEWGYGWSPTRITLSTVGVLPSLERFLRESNVHLAVSLHNPFADQRAEIMPVEKAYPARELIALIKKYDFTHQRRISFEYIVMKGVNDSMSHVNELARLLNGMKCRINLIKFHANEGSSFVSPDEHGMVRLRDSLTAKGIITTIRTSRGEDIGAACGLLSTREKSKR